jgi:hypothetical protein
VHHFHKVHLFDEIDHFVQTGIDVSAIIAHHTDTDLCPLPQVIISNLRDGNIETASYPIDQFSDHMALSLQGVIFWYPKVELTNPDDHFP